MRRNVLRKRQFRSLEREFVFRQESGGPILYFLGRAQRTLQMRHGKALVRAPNVRSQLERESRRRKNVARVCRGFDGFLDGRLDMFAQRQRLVIGHFRQIAGIRDIVSIFGL